MTERQFITVQGRRLEYVRLPSARPRANARTIVFLHEGLGSIAMWRDFPQRVADATGCEALVYSRYGYGRSDPLEAPRRAHYLHDEALLALPELLDQLDIEKPFLLGHSDGGSIALIHAGGAARPVSGIVVMAPHVMNEPLSRDGIRDTISLWETTPLRERLARFHDDVDSAFEGWANIWMHEEFLDWNIEEYLPRINCPVLAIQGEGDEYGTMAQIDRIALGAPHTTLLKLPDCGHSPHKDQPQVVIEATRALIDAEAP